jgi:hypothetical protein
MSLICDTFDAPPPTDAMLHSINTVTDVMRYPYSPSPTRSNLPIKITGTKTGTKRGPSYANSLFVGKWGVSSNIGGAFDLDFIQLPGGNLFAEIADGNVSDQGTLRGSMSDPLHAQLTLKQPGLNRSGIVEITLISDGSSFTGTGTLSDNQTLTWQGTKK